MATRKPTFARLVRRWRIARQLSKVEAARNLRVPYRTFQDWEYSRRTPTGIRRRLLEQMFNEPALTAKKK